MFKKMQTGDVVTIRSEAEANLFTKIHDQWILADWNNRKGQVAKTAEGVMVYLYGKDEQVRFIQNYFLPDVGPIPDGYEPAFEGEIIQSDWLTWYNVEREWKRTRVPGCKLEFGEYIKPKQKPSAGAIVRNESGTAVGVVAEPADNQWDKAVAKWIDELSEMISKRPNYINPPTPSPNRSELSDSVTRKQEIMEVVKFALENM